MTLAAARMVVALRRARAATSLQATQDTVAAIQTGRPFGAVVAVVQGTQAKVATLEGLTAPLVVHGARVAGGRPRLAGAAPDAVPCPLHRPSPARSPFHEAHGARPGQVATRKVTAGLRGRPGVGRLAPVPRQGVPRPIDVVAAPNATA